MIREGQLKSHQKNGLLAGAILALALSIITSLFFKPGLLGLPGLITWYVVSFLCGGAAGFAGALLVSRIPVRLSSVINYLVGALFGAFGYYLQLYLFLLYMFSKNPTLF